MRKRPGHDRNLPDDSGRSLIDYARDQVANAKKACRPDIQSLPPPDSFPGFRIISELRRGGQGVVYEAFQPTTKRTVALKALHGRSFADPRDKARFDREIEILAQLKHPNIVSLHDAAVTDQGPFFVMDFISGRPLDEYVKDEDLSVQETIRLFAKVCDAVNAAHVRGVVHRDLKPSNILVDEQGEPHVLDFGLSKITAPDDPGAPRGRTVTETGQFVGSLPWATPEQAEGASDKIDVRTDVYALGLVLFQALTGYFPYEVTGSLRDVLDNILNATPLKPSALRPDIPSDVDTIVLKCLSKERERRYQTAGEVGLELERFIRGEPILAHPPSAVYFLKKFARRNRALVGGIGIALLAIIGGATAATWQAVAATAQRNRAVTAERQAATVNDFLQRMLSSANPEITGPDTKIADVLKEAERNLETSFAEQPETRAALHETIARAYHGLGDYKAAETHFASALELYRGLWQGPHPKTAAALNELATERSYLADYVGAEESARQALEMRRALYGDEHVEVAESLATLAGIIAEHARSTTSDYSEAEQLARDALAMRRRLVPTDDDGTVEITGHLADILGFAGKNAEATDLYSQMRRILLTLHGPDYPALFEATNSYCLMLQQRKDSSTNAQLRDEIEKLRLENLAAGQRRFGPDHPALAYDFDNLGHFYDAVGDLEASENYHRQAMELRRRRLGNEHPETVTSINNLAYVLVKREKFAEAEELFREILPSEERASGSEHRTPLLVRSNIAVLVERQGRLEEAETWYRDILERRRKSLGETDPDTLDSWVYLSRLVRRQDRLDEAEPLFRETLDLCRLALGQEDRKTVRWMKEVGELLLQRQKPGEAEPVLRQALGITTQWSPPAPRFGLELQLVLGKCLVAMEKFQEAESVLKAAFDGLRETAGLDDATTQDVIQTLVGLYESWNKPDQAEQYRAMVRS